MEEDSTPVATEEDTGLDLSGEDSQDDTVDTTADSSDDDTSDSDDDNAPSDADDESGDDDKSTKDASKAKDAPTFDKDLDAWAEKRGYGTLETDKERRIAQDARNSQGDFTKRAQAAKKLTDNIEKTAQDDIKGDDDADPLVKRLDNMEQELMSERQNRQVSDFVYSMSEAGTPVTEAESDAMGELLAQTAKTDGQAGVNFLLKNISRWHALAKVESGTDKTETDTEAEKVRQEERDRLAKKTNAAGPNRSAKATVPAKEKNELEEIWKDDSI